MLLLRPVHIASAPVTIAIVVRSLGRRIPRGGFVLATVLLTLLLLYGCLLLEVDLLFEALTIVFGVLVLDEGKARAT
jgi:hypothetical protein